MSTFLPPHNLTSLFHVGMDRHIPDFHLAPSGPAINVGAGNKVISGAKALDYPEWDADTMPLPYGDESIGTIHAYHFLEHVQEPVKLLLEFQRILVPHGVANIVVPYYSSAIAAQDLDHKHAFTEETWKTLFKNQYYNKNRIEWRFHVGLNVIMGIAERNVCLVTQLVKFPSLATPKDAQ